MAAHVIEMKHCRRLELPAGRHLHEVFDIFHREEEAIFLDSSLEGDKGRFSILGLAPHWILKEEDGVATCNGRPMESSFEEGLTAYLNLVKEDKVESLPLTTGCLGYFTYDYGRKFEKIASRHEKKIRMPEAQFVFYDLLLVEDHKEDRIRAIIRKDASDQARIWLKQIGEFLAERPEKIGEEEEDKRENRPALAKFHANFEKEEYKKTIKQMIDHIVAGDIYIANMTQQLTVESPMEPYEFYRILRRKNPAPFACYLNSRNYKIAGSSPERFLQVRDGQVETCPIKGTRKRGETEEEDRALREELAASSKDKSELLMIVDLERNDLNHVCKPGSVKVTEHFAIHSFATVHHLVTTIVGKMEEKKSLVDLVKASFPGGSITGAPKIRAMEIIDKLENDMRGLYTGSVGYLSADGSCDLNIVIRTAVWQDGSYHIGVGGGITCESDLEFEYEETLQKAKSLLEVLGEGENYSR